MNLSDYQTIFPEITVSDRLSDQVNPFIYLYANILIQWKTKLHAKKSRIVLENGL